MILPKPQNQYDVRDESVTRSILEQADRQNVKFNRDYDVADGRIILTSPNGTRYAIEVDNAGALSTTAI